MAGNTDPALTTICVVENDTTFSEALELVINQTPNLRCLGRYRTGELALREVPIQKPEVLLLDLHLPGMSGTELIWKLKEVLPALQVLVLTVHDEPDWLFAALEAGALGYLIKPVSFNNVLQAILELRTGGAPMSAAIARKVLATLHHRGESKRQLEVLTPREREVLELIAKGMPNRTIAQHLGLSHFTIRAHVATILNKLHVRSRTEAAAKFLGGPGI